MFLRLFLLLSIIGHVGPSNYDGESETHGKWAGNIFGILVVVGAIVLITLVVIGCLALGGHFEDHHINPAT